MVEFTEGAVCYADKDQLTVHGSLLEDSEGYTNNYMAALSCKDFKLNEPREGWYIPKSELDTEEKYNKAVEVFGLFGYCFVKDAIYGYNKDNQSITLGNTCNGVGLFEPKTNQWNVIKCTYAQLMAIGELKRKMVERERSKMETCTPVPFEVIGAESDFNSRYEIHIDTTSISRAEGAIDKTKRRNRSKQAYDILEGLDYEYDQVKQQWYKKEWV